MPCCVLTLPNELIDEILGYLIELTRGLKVLTVTSRRDLLSCALACSAFFRPTIRVLWNNVELMPVLKLLPGFGVVDGYYIITRQLNDDSLTRFDLYASMVRRLVVPNAFRVHPSVYAALDLVRPRPLPSLTSVYCFAETFFDKSMFMISPCLQTVIFVNCRSRDLERYFSAVKDEAPMLRSVSVTRPVRGKFDLSAASQFRNLRIFGLNLNQLCLKDTQSVSYSRSVKQLDLHERAYRPQDVSTAFTVLEAYRDAEIESFSLDGTQYTTGDYEKIFLVLSSQWSCTMTRLSLELGMGRLLMGKDRTTFSDCITPLYGLKNLQVFSLRISAPGPIMTDTLVSSVCEAFPNLTDLTMSSLGFDLLPTVTSLKTLSKRCPSLKRVSIPLDIARIPTIDQKTPIRPTSSHGLQCMTVLVKDDTVLRNLLANGSATLSYHFGVMFPCLKDVFVKSLYGRTESWNRIMEMVGVQKIEDAPEVAIEDHCLKGRYPLHPQGAPPLSLNTEDDTSRSPGNTGNSIVPFNAQPHDETASVNKLDQPLTPVKASIFNSGDTSPIDIEFPTRFPKIGYHVDFFFEDLGLSPKLAEKLSDKFMFHPHVFSRELFSELTDKDKCDLTEKEAGLLIATIHRYFGLDVL